MEQENHSLDLQNTTELLTPLDLNNFRLGAPHKATSSVKYYFPFGFFIRQNIGSSVWNRVESISTYCSTNRWRFVVRTINQNLYQCVIDYKRYIIGKNCIFDEDFNLLVYVQATDDYRSRFVYDKTYIRLGSFIDGRSEKNALSYLKSISQHLEFVDDMSPFYFRVNTNFKTRSEKKLFDVKLTDICNNLLKVS